MEFVQGCLHWHLLGTCLHLVISTHPFSILCGMWQHLPAKAADYFFLLGKSHSRAASFPILPSFCSQSPLVIPASPFMVHSFSAKLTTHGLHNNQFWVHPLLIFHTQYHQMCLHLLSLNSFLNFWFMRLYIQGLETSRAIWHPRVDPRCVISTLTVFKEYYTRTPTFQLMLTKKRYTK